MNSEKKEHFWRIIFKSDTRAGKQFDLILLVAILLSILAVVLESIESLNSRYHGLFQAVEWTITGVFTLEYVARIYLVRNKFRYIFSFYGIVDLLSIVPSYLGLVFVGSQSLLVIRAIRLVRVFRIMKLSRYTNAGNMIMSALRSSLVKISVFLFAVLTMTIIIGTTMYLVEGKENGFDNIPKSLYWAIVTLTTVGYGDISPQTPLGQFIASIVMVIGYGIIAVPTGIVTAQVISEQKEKKHYVCPECGENKHASDASFCKSCGQPIHLHSS